MHFGHALCSLRYPFFSLSLFLETPKTVRSGSQANHVNMLIIFIMISIALRGFCIWDEYLPGYLIPWMLMADNNWYLEMSPADVQLEHLISNCTRRSHGQKEPGKSVYSMASRLFKLVLLQRRPLKSERHQNCSCLALLLILCLKPLKTNVIREWRELKNHMEEKNKEGMKAEGGKDRTIEVTTK